MLNIDKLNLAAKRLRALAHPLRIAIIEKLSADSELSVTEIYNYLKIEQAVASHHLSILKKNGLLFTKRVGKNIYYSLKIQELSQVIECVNKCDV